MGLNRGSKGLTECIISFCVCHENQVTVYPTLIFSFLYKFTFSFLVLLSQHKNRIASIIWKKMPLGTNTLMQASICLCLIKYLSTVYNTWFSCIFYLKKIYSNNPHRHINKIYKRIS